MIQTYYGMVKTYYGMIRTYYVCLKYLWCPRIRKMHPKILKGFSLGLSFQFFEYKGWVWVWVFCKSLSNYE